MGLKNGANTNDGSKKNKPHDDPAAVEATEGATGDDESLHDVGGTYGGLRRENTPQSGEDHGQPLHDVKRAHSSEARRYRQQTGELPIGSMVQQHVADHDEVGKAVEVDTTHPLRKPVV